MCPANLHELRLGLEEVRLRREGGCKRRAQESARKGSVLGKGADGVAGKRDVTNAGAECYVVVPYLGDSLKFVDVRSDLTFGGIEMNV